jgi:excisionase family DNA binding protein
MSASLIPATLGAASLPPGVAAYTAKQVARSLQVCERTIRRWAAENKIKAIRRGRTVRIPRAEVERLLDAR